MPLTKSVTKSGGQRQSSSSSSSSSLSERDHSKSSEFGTQDTVELQDDKNNEMSMDTSTVNESCDKESWLDRGDHPLMNDLVLTLFFPYVKTNDLKVCRLVCKKWNILIIPHTRSKLQVKICDNEEPSLGISKFVRLMKSNTLGIPFGTFRLEEFHTRTGVGKQFLKLCGNTAKRFDFDSKRYRVSVENISTLLGSAPNLEYFTMPCQMCSQKKDVVKLFHGTGLKLPFLRTLNLENEKPKYRRKICPTFFEEFLSAARNISTFILYDEFGPAKDCGSLDVLNTLEKLGREASIKNLLFLYVTVEHLKLLRTMASKGLKLERLDLNFEDHRDEDSTTDLFEVVNLFSDTLQILHARSYRTTTLKFKKMPKLKLLHLNLTANSRIEINNLNNIFPVLETLHLNFDCVSSRPNNPGQQLDDLLLQDECCPNLKSLIIENDTIKSEIFTTLINVFPSLTHLELKISKDTSVNIFKEIWTHMKCLEKLNIYGDVDTKESLSYLIAGISESDIQELGCWDRPFGLKAFNNMTPEVRRNAILQKLNSVPDCKNRPSIRNLTNLKYLRLCVDKHDCWGITDMTAYFGFYLMNLRHLYLHHSTMLTNTCAEALVNDLGLQSWIFLRGSRCYNTSAYIIPARYDLNNAKDFPYSEYPNSIYCNKSNL